MNENIDQSLKTHFSQKHDVPTQTKLALREKLYASLQPREKLSFIWLLVLCTALAAVAIFLAVEMLFGINAAILLCIGYYFVAVAGGMAVLIFTVMTKKTKITT